MLCWLPRRLSRSLTCRPSMERRTASVDCPAVTWHRTSIGVVWIASALQLGELRIDQRRKRVSAAGRDRDSDMFGKVMERAPGLIQRGGLDLPECRDVLLQHGCAVRCGRADTANPGVMNTSSSRSRADG